ncbi:hypothetical protein D3C86_1772310 [compost metagenome]
MNINVMKNMGIRMKIDFRPHVAVFKNMEEMIVMIHPINLKSVTMIIIGTLPTLMKSIAFAKKDGSVCVCVSE